jgi:hypothetical protein
MCGSERSKIVHDILAYLADNPAAEDTIEGIAEWWLLEQHAKQQVAQVQGAIAQLVGEGLLLERKDKESRVHYRVNRKKRKEVTSLLKQTPRCCG